MNIRTFLKHLIDRSDFSGRGDDASSRASTSREGGALLTTVIFTLVISSVLGVLANSSGQRAFTLNREAQRLKALSIAEAGLSRSMGEIVADISLIDKANPILQSSFSGGHYEVSVSVPDGAEEGVLMLTSVGTYQEQSIESVATVAYRVKEEEVDEEGPTVILGPYGPVGLLSGIDMEMTGGIFTDLKELGAHANGNLRFSGGPELLAAYLSANGKIEFNGNPTVNLASGTGVMHADGVIDFSGGTVNAAQIISAVEIIGSWGASTNAENIAPTVTWPEWYNPKPPITEKSVPLLVSLSMPPLDVEAYRAYAQANGYYYEGNQNINRSWLTKDIKERTGEKVNNNETLVKPVGGVLFVDGDARLNSDMELEGMLFATGDVTINGAAKYNNITQFPAIVSSDGDISLGGGSDGVSKNGWIYAMNGSVTASGGASNMTGIVAAENIRIRGGFSIGDSDSDSSFTWPGQDSDDEGGGNSGGVDMILLSWIR